MSRGIAPETFPREAAPLAAMIEPFEQEFVDRPFKAVQGAAVVGHPKVVEVAAHLPRDRLPEVGEFTRMALLAKPLGEVSQGAAQPFLRGLTLDTHQPIAAPTPVMGEAKVVHRRWAVPRLECLPRTLFAKGEEVRLVGVQAQTEFPQPQREDAEKTVGIVLTLKERHRIIRVPQDRTVAAAVPRDDCGKPLVQDRIQEHIGDHW